MTVTRSDRAAAAGWRSTSARAVGNHQFGKLADERHVVDDVVGDAPADVAHDHRVAQSEAEDRRRFDSGIKACDDHDVEVWQRGCPFVTTRGGEGLVTLECGCEMPHGRSPMTVAISRAGLDAFRSAEDAWRAAQADIEGALGDGSPATLDLWLARLTENETAPSPPRRASPGR